MVVKKPKRIYEFIFTGLKYSCIFIIITVFLDSLFWGRLCWAELEVFYFNTILKRTEIVLAILKQHSKFWLTEADQTWFGNPFDDIKGK